MSHMGGEAYSGSLELLRAWEGFEFRFPSTIIHGLGLRVFGLCLGFRVSILRLRAEQLELRSSAGPQFQTLPGSRVECRRVLESSIRIGSRGREDGAGGDSLVAGLTILNLDP